MLETNITLNQRDYWRCYQYSPHTHVADTFINNVIPPAELAIVSPIIHSSNTRKIAALHHAKSYAVPDSMKLRKFLTPEKQMIGASNADIILNIPNHTNFEEFINLWCTLYETARQQIYSHDLFGIIWSVLAHEGNDIDPILALQAVATNPEAFSTIPTPSVSVFKLSEGEYSVSGMRKFLKKHTVITDQWQRNEFPVIQQFNKPTDQIIEDILAHINHHWPCPEVETMTKFIEAPPVNVDTLFQMINKQLSVWYANHQYHTFVGAVIKRLEELSKDATKLNELDEFPVFHEPMPQYLTKYQIPFKLSEECVDEYSSELVEAEAIWFDGQKNTRVRSEWWDMYRDITNGGCLKHFEDAGLLPRCVPSLVLPQIMTLSTDSDAGQRQLCALIGVIALSTVHEQRARRIAAYEMQMKLKADHEIEPHTNWQPCEYPEWLLFEIEQDLCIRPIQIEVAKRMIDPMTDGNDCKHAVMQLNMGEGKTSVIVPILAARLANGKQVCQITVLKSLFVINSNALRQSLGGWLNHRVYHFPCRRDMPIGERSANLLDLYKECMEQRGKWNGIL